MYPSLILVHGAATGAWIWDSWRRQLASLGWDVNVLDLRGHGRSLPTDLGWVTMEDYFADLESVAGQIASAKGAHPIVGGWGMGGLLALMYAAAHAETPALLLFSPDQPLEVAGKPTMDELRRYPDPVLKADAFGINTEDPVRTSAALGLTRAEALRVIEQSTDATESGRAHRQRLRGISVPEGAVACPSLLLYGETESEAARDDHRTLAALIGGAALVVPSASHWGVVFSETAVQRAAPGVDAWLRANLKDSLTSA
jgi:pimeloyl-ACP methyl ester carboxylesterase